MSEVHFHFKDGEVDPSGLDSFLPELVNNIHRLEKGDVVRLNGGLYRIKSIDRVKLAAGARDWEPYKDQLLYDANAYDDFDPNETRAPSGSAKGGQWTSTGGGGGRSSSKSAHLASAPKNKAQWPNHILKLKLPPAWTDVRISSDPKADLQATGHDAKGRLQYVYNPKFAEKQQALKFKRIKALDTKFSKILAQNDKNMKSKNVDVAEAAACQNLIMKMGLRPGSDRDTQAAEKAFGATNLQGQHVIADGNKVSLVFTGKKGVHLNLPVTDPDLKKDLVQRSRRVGPDGPLFNTDETMLRRYVGKLGGGGFKVKDFRTYLGTSLASALVGANKVVPKNAREYKKAVMDVAKVVSERLGNTPSVALKSYISPFVFAEWKQSMSGSAGDSANDAAFVESQHPRGQPENAGEFASKEGTASNAIKPGDYVRTKSGSAFTIRKIEGGRAYPQTGRSVPLEEVELRRTKEDIEKQNSERAASAPPQSAPLPPSVPKEPEKSTTREPTEKDYDAFKEYTGVNFHYANAIARGRRENLGRRQKEIGDSIFRRLDKAWETVPPMAKPETFYRGVNSAHTGIDLQNVEESVGKTITDNGWISTSSDVNAARGFARGNLRGAPDYTGGILFHIDVPAGVRVLNVDKVLGTTGGHYENEHERLLPRGSKFKVLSASPGDGKNHPAQVRLQYVEDVVGDDAVFDEWVFSDSRFVE